MRSLLPLFVLLQACSAASKGSGSAASATTTDTGEGVTVSSPTDTGTRPTGGLTDTAPEPTTPPTTPGLDGCGDTAPVLHSLDAEGTFDGTDVGVVFVGELTDDDGGLHEAVALLWYDLRDDGVVDTSGDPALRIPIDTDALDCEAPELTATVRVGLDFGQGGPFEASIRFEDADGHLSEAMVAAACVPEADGTPCTL